MSDGRTYEDYLLDILEAAEHARSFVEGLSFDDFKRDIEKQFAVTRALEIIGEAARYVPESVQSQYPTIPWKDMVGMRNVVIHRYFGVDTAVIWRTVQEELPPLITTVHKILNEL